MLRIILAWSFAIALCLGAYNLGKYIKRKRMERKIMKRELKVWFEETMEYKN